ncbi:hypothetical protein D9758_004539 [Tetrapyrgos nigripes]|uniref:CBM1 domain-containing protein n=1 Tax=Tetrapyrgos nigripes TaxID=182062 RepID=A0A8H5GZT9_9AGAR|nr:hypothetical protein D9758_004539 [Tetrapyrgos nigripes]
MKLERNGILCVISTSSKRSHGPIQFASSRLTKVITVPMTRSSYLPTNHLDLFRAAYISEPASARGTSTKTNEEGTRTLYVDQGFYVQKSQIDSDATFQHHLRKYINRCYSSKPFPTFSTLKLSPRTRTRNNMAAIFLPLLGLATLAAAQCPQVHVIGARETTAPAGYGTCQSVVQNIVSAFPGATSEALNYPACGGQAQCGGVSYASSVIAGIQAATSAINNFNNQCPNSIIVLCGYSQGGQVFDDVYCGGGDTNEGYGTTAIPISANAQKKIAAAILMGDPRHIPGLSYNVGTCQANGFAPRPAGFQCPYASNIQSYCDSSDPYCCNGNNANTHQGYANEYGSQALTFVKNKVNALLSGTGSTGGGGGSGTTSAPSGGSTPPSGGGGAGSAQHWGQCGGIGWTGPSSCVSGFTLLVGVSQGRKDGKEVERVGGSK